MNKKILLASIIAGILASLAAGGSIGTSVQLGSWRIISGGVQEPDRLVVVGTVRNNTDRSAYAMPAARVALLDINGDTIVKADAHTYVPLSPRGTACWTATFYSVPRNWEQVVAVAGNAISAREGPLADVVTEKLHLYRQGEHIVAYGSVRNSGGATLAIDSIAGTLVDTDGRVLACDETGLTAWPPPYWPYTLAPSESRDFAVLFRDVAGDVGEMRAEIDVDGWKVEEE